jgi:hypothetical protein
MNGNCRTSRAFEDERAIDAEASADAGDEKGRPPIGPLTAPKTKNAANRSPSTTPEQSP